MKDGQRFAFACASRKRQPCSVRRLADLVLPTGRLLVGLPHVTANSPTRAVPQLPPGRYPVYLNCCTFLFAFAVVKVSDRPVKVWEPARSFFTDSGTGCFVDAAYGKALAENLTSQSGFDIKHGVYDDGDGGFLIDPSTGANAILWKTLDCRYPCFIGRAADGEVAQVVADGRRSWWRDNTVCWYE